MVLEGIRVSHYQILRLIGTGGMGEVYLAQDTRIARQVAIKVIRNEALSYPHTEEAKSSHRLFEREMKAIAMLDHPNILPLYDFGEEHIAQSLLTYMVMPFRPEGSLAHWVDRHYQDRSLPLQTLLSLVRQAASALQHAHNAHVIHLDVKPSNFLIRQQEQASDCPDLLLTDFGISRFHTATATASQSIRGTPLYMAPEQWTNAPVPQTDQYALAIMVYQLLTGMPPFQGNMQQVMYQHLQVAPKPPGERNAHIPPAVDDVLLRALAKQPEERFASVAQFADALASAWQPATPFTESSGDPESLILTERIQPEVEASSPLPPTLPPSSAIDPAASGMEKQPVRRIQAPIFTSPESGPSVEPLREPLDTITPALPARSQNKRNALLPVVIGLCLLLALVGIGTGVYLTHSFGPISAPTSTTISTLAATSTSLPTPTNTPEPPTPTSAPVPTYPQLKPFYSGTATGYANATITFSLQAEDQQGNVKMQTTFQRTDNQASAIYDCQGQVSQDNQLTLSCTEVGVAQFQLSIHGTIFPDGHMEGTEEATDTDDSTYDHLYNWSVS
jgi:serine/threonine protein kinase